MKKLISMLMVAVMVLGLVACGGAKEETKEPAGATGENITLKVWGSQNDQALIKELCEAFAAEHPENTWSFEYGVVGEADAQARYLEDPSAAADVFSFPDDQINALVKADALYEVTRNVDAIKAANAAGTVTAASYDGALYGYPMTADNGYFLYYDKSVLNDEDVQTLDGLLAAANAAGKKVLMDVSNGWYIASFFLGNGCTLTLDTNGKCVCDFNTAAGLDAAEGIRAFCNDPAFITGDDSVLVGGMGDTICAGVSGPWNSTPLKDKLGDNLGAVKLPTFTCGGKQVQMYSFLGCKVLGVNTQSAHPVEAMELAEYLTSEEAQQRRFELLGYGPSNINVAASDAVQADVALSALAEQSKYSISQHVGDNYWTPAEALGTELEAHTTADLQPLLDAIVDQATAE